MNKYYVAVPVGENLPKEKQQVFGIDDKGCKYSVFYTYGCKQEIEFDDDDLPEWVTYHEDNEITTLNAGWYQECENQGAYDHITYPRNIVHWLELREGVLLQTEEVEGLLKMAFNQGIANAVYGEGSKEYMSFENWIEENLTPANQK